MVVGRDPYRPILDGEIAAAIGELVATLSGIQMGLAVLMADLSAGRNLDINNPNDLIALMPLMGMDPRAQVGILKTLLLQRLPRHEAVLLVKLLERIYAIKRIRDKVAHGIWEKNPKTGRMFALSLKTTHPAKLIRTHFTGPHLRDLAGELDDLFCQLLDSVQPHGYLTSNFDSWRGKRP